MSLEGVKLAVVDRYILIDESDSLVGLSQVTSIVFPLMFLSRLTAVGGFGPVKSRLTGVVAEPELPARSVPVAVIFTIPSVSLASKTR